MPAKVAHKYLNTHLHDVICYSIYFLPTPGRVAISNGLINSVICWITSARLNRLKPASCSANGPNNVSSLQPVTYRHGTTVI